MAIRDAIRSGDQIGRSDRAIRSGDQIGRSVGDRMALVARLDVLGVRDGDAGEHHHTPVDLLEDGVARRRKKVPAVRRNQSEAIRSNQQQISQRQSCEPMEVSPKQSEAIRSKSPSGSRVSRWKSAPAIRRRHWPSMAVDGRPAVRGKTHCDEVRNSLAALPLSASFRATPDLQSYGNRRHCHSE